MSGNAVTDKHVSPKGIGTWDPKERYHQIRQRAGLNEDKPIPHRAKRSGKSLPAKPTWKDFTPGMQVICWFREFISGYLVYLHVEVIDAVGDLPPRGLRGSGEAVYAVVLATTSEKYDGMVGHIVGLAYGDDRYHTRATVTRKTVGEFSRMPKDKVKKAPRP